MFNAIPTIYSGAPYEPETCCEDRCEAYCEECGEAVCTSAFDLIFDGERYYCTRAHLIQGLARADFQPVNNVLILPVWRKS